MSLIQAMALAILLSTQPAWELLRDLGRVKVVYVEPSRIKDKEVLASAVNGLLDKFGKEKAMELNFFDAREGTPEKLPFPAGTRDNHRAKFNFNPANGMKRFVWIGPVDPNTGRRTEIEDTLPLDLALGP